ncbi:MAG: formate/nitrite transporter family protein [Oscillospiraceae bacterium]|nr:formate/nitrite transporter family protein [Oscillospiraceae bacterium]
MLTSKEIAENYLVLGRKKAQAPLGRLLVLSMLAGAFIALAGAVSTTASCTVENSSLAKVVSACLFPGGLALVILAGTELFTGNCLLVVPLLRGELRLREVLRSWVTVYLGNFAGALLVAAVCVWGHQLDLFSGKLAAATISTAAAKCTLSFGDAFFRGVACNFLVCMAVWLAMGAKSAGGKLAALYFPVLFFVLCGFEHSIANMYYIGAGLFAQTVPAYAAPAAGLTVGGFLLGNLLPVTLGNMAGGMLVGVAFWFCWLREPEKG